MKELSEQTTGWTRARRVCVFGMAGLLLASVVFGLAVIFRDKKSDAKPGVERNPGGSSEADLDSDYVGWQRCAECHDEQAQSHVQSGHSHTFALTRDSAVAQSLCGRSIKESDDYGRFEYSCDDEGLMVGLPERYRGRLFPLDFAFGSGKHAVTFFTLLPGPTGEKTVGVEHRLTWYSSDSALDVTPAQEDLKPGEHVQYFGRVIRDEDLLRCIDCHTTAGEIVDHRLVHVIPNVQCEECHGPGRAHVAAAEAEDEDRLLQTIAKPGSASDEVALCGRCHRMPDEIAPDRLKRYPNSLVRFQPVGLLQSRCSTETPGGLACTTCHNPHEPAGSVSDADHEQTCLKCHSGSEQSVCPVSPATDCITCHMPSIDLVRGISFHDHWIRVRSDKSRDARDGDESHSAESHSTLSPDR